MTLQETFLYILQALAKASWHVIWKCGPAHTEASAKGLSEVIEAVHRNRPLALVVAMASDKDHFSFAKQLLSGTISSINLVPEIHRASKENLEVRNNVQIRNTSHLWPSKTTTISILPDDPCKKKKMSHMPIKDVHNFNCAPHLLEFSLKGHNSLFFLTWVKIRTIFLQIIGVFSMTSITIMLLHFDLWYLHYAWLYIY